MKYNLCTINLNEGEGRQTIYWDSDDHLLYSNAMDDAIDCPACGSIEEAQDVAQALWGRDAAWDLEWIENDLDA